MRRMFGNVLVEQDQHVTSELPRDAKAPSSGLAARCQSVGEQYGTGNHRGPDPHRTRANYFVTGTLAGRSFDDEVKKDDDKKMPGRSVGHFT